MVAHAQSRAIAVKKKAMRVEPNRIDVADIVAQPYIPVIRNAIINTNLVRVF
jgi:hypothetical protein